MKIIALIVLLNGILFGMSENELKVNLKLKISEANNITETWGEQNDKGFITGVLYSNPSLKLIGSWNKVDFGFFDDMSKIFWFKEENSKANVTDELYDKFYPSDSYNNDNLFYTDAVKILQYGFYPQKAKLSDSLRIYLKYVLYEKKSKVKTNKNNYDISFNERFFTVPINKEIEFDFLKDIFPEEETNKAIFYLDEKMNSPKQPTINLSDYKLGLNEIDKSVRKTAKENSNIKINAEYIRSDKNGNNLLLKNNFRSFEEINRVHTGDFSFLDFFLNLYKMEVTVPFIMLNKSKEQLFSKSKLYNDSKLDYSITAIPLNKKGNSYSFNVIICRGLWNGQWTYAKKIELEIDKPLRIELEGAIGLLRNTERIDGQLLRLNSKEDYADYVNEYLILTLTKN